MHTYMYANMSHGAKLREKMSLPPEYKTQRHETFTGVTSTIHTCDMTQLRYKPTCI